MSQLISRSAASVPTSDVQLALHLILAQLVDRHAGVFASVEGARLANVEGQHPLVVLHQVLWILANNHLVLHPDDLRLCGTHLHWGERWRGGCVTCWILLQL